MTDPVAIAKTNDQQNHTYRLTEAQLEVWLASQQSDEANCAYNECSSLLLVGTLETDALQRALEQVVQRHEVLRSTFSKDGRFTTIHDHLPFDYTFVDWAGHSQRMNRPSGVERRSRKKGPPRLIWSMAPC